MFNLVSTETAELLISHPRLLDSLIRGASAPNQGERTPESANTMAFRTLHALDQAVASRGSEEIRLTMRQAIEQVNAARRLQNMAVHVHL